MKLIEVIALVAIVGFIVGVGINVWKDQQKRKTVRKEFFNKDTIEWSNEEMGVYNKINLYRKSLGKNMLYKSDLLYDLADIRVDDNIEYGMITHEGFGPARETMMECGLVQGAEVLASGYRYPATAVKAWIESDQHREALEHDWKYMGAVVKQDEEGKRYFVVIFGR